MLLPEKLPIGIAYQSTFYGGVVKSQYEAKLIYRWGAKGTCGMQAEPLYYVPILGGHVGEYVSPDVIPDLILGLAP